MFILVGVLPGQTSQDISTISLIVFPIAGGSSFTSASAESVQRCADRLSEILNDGLSQSRRFNPIWFDSKIPTLKRAVEERKITEQELSEPFDTTVEGRTRACRLAQLLNAQIAVIGSVDAYEFREADSEVELTVTVQLIDVLTTKFNTITASGHGKAVEPGLEEVDIANLAVYDVADKLLRDMVTISPQDLAGSSAPDEATEIVSRPRMGKQFITAVIGAVILGYLIGSK